MGDSRVIVLLGAGASVDAGLPLTSQLAARLVDAANSGRSRRPPTPMVQALNFTYGALVGHHAESGRNPLEAVNIERLNLALLLLQHSGCDRDVRQVIENVVRDVTSPGSPEVFKQVEDWLLAGIKQEFGPHKSVACHPGAARWHAQQRASVDAGRVRHPDTDSVGS